jgi:diguanylate cyclase (GGDEF)-like protein
MESRHGVHLAPLVRRETNGALLVFDQDLRFVTVEGSALPHLGLSRDTEGLLLRELVRPPTGTDEPRLSFANLPAAESLLRSVVEGAAYEFQMERGECVFMVRLAPLPGEHGARQGLAMLFDITDQHRETLALRQANQQLREQSLTDTLTGLHNRRGFIALAEQALLGAQRVHHELALFFIDLNGLKTINDQLGHEIGDLALRDAARVLRETFREADVLARLGGDEFVALVTAEHSDVSELLTKRLGARVAAHNATELRNFTLSLSIGSAIYDPRAPKSLSALLAEADGAMYERKRAYGLSRPPSLVPAQSPKQFA